METMEDYFEGTDELPSVRLISRDDFSEENFDVDEFLTRIHKYQTLDDLQQQLKSWDDTLGDELNDTVNENYPGFMDLGKSLTGGEGVIGDIKVEVRSFQSSLTKIQYGLTESGNESRNLLHEHIRLTGLETDASMLLALSRQLTDLDAQLTAFSQGLSVPSIDDLQEVVKSVLLVQRWSAKLKKYPLQAVYRMRVAQSDNEIKNLLKSALASNSASSEEKSRLLDLCKKFYAGRDIYY